MAVGLLEGALKEGAPADAILTSGVDHLSDNPGN